MRGKRIHRLLSIVLVVVVLLSALPLTALASTDKPAGVNNNGQPFSSGTGGSNNFRIPALITLSNDNLLAAADARYSGTDDGYGLDTIVSYSADEGGTWNYSYVNYFNDSNGYNTNASAFIDPVLVQGKDGTVYLFTDLFPGGGHNISRIETGTGFVDVGDVSYLALYSTSDAPSSDTPSYYVANVLNEDGYYTVYYCNDNSPSDYALDAEYNIYEVSGDVYTAVEGTQLDSSTTIQANVFYTGAANPDGPYVLGTQYITMRKGTVNDDDSITWYGLQLLNVKKKTESFYGLGPGGGIVTSTGRIIVPLYTFANGSDGYTSVIYSDDNGKTWTRSEDMNVRTSEASISEVTVGGQNYLYMFTRHGGYFVSEDDGETWSDQQTVSDISYTTGCELSTLTYSQLIDGCPAILLSAPTGDGIFNDRTNGKIFVGLVQSDGSINWKYTYQVNDNTFKYSDLAELSDGFIGLLYESGDAAITYTNLQISEIAEGAKIGVSEPETPDNNARVDVSLYVGQSKTYTDETGNYAGSYDGNDLNIRVATVDVTGQDAQPGSEKYEQVNATCNDLISTNSTSWVKTDNYYYRHDNDKNYYPVYAKRSEGYFFGPIYTYTWGYSKTDSSVNVENIKRLGQITSNTSEETNFDVYKKSLTPDVPPSTTITIKGVAPGDTSVTVGTTTYNITVNELPPDLDLETTPFVAETGEGYGKKVTKLTTSEGLTFDLGLTTTSSNVDWSVADPSIATVYQDGRVTGRMAGETTVTATIDGVAYTIPVVIRADANSRQTKIYDIYLIEIANTSVYMSICCSTDLIEVQAGEAIYLSFDSRADTAVDFFGAPDEGYALTRMKATNSHGYYQALDNSNPKLTDFYTAEGTAGYIQREYFTDNGVAAMVQAALNEGCDGGLGFTRPASDDNSVTSDLTFRSEKLPTVSKEVATVNGVPYTEGMVAHAGETVVFKVTVTQYAAEDDITYTSVTLTDNLSGAVFAGTSNNRETIHLSNVSVSEDTTYTYDVEYIIKDDDLDKTITNTVDLTYTYQSEYSSGSFESKASADARITAASFEPEDIVIDFGLPVTMDYSDDHGKYNLASGTAKYGDVTVDSNKVTYTPKRVLPEADTVTLENEVGAAYTFQVIPASNVLYEETFLTVAEDWTETDTSQTTTQSCDNDLRYGYDEVAYNVYADYSNGTVYQATGLSADKLSTGKLSTSFYGNGFDLIGECAPDTAMVYLVIKDASGKAVKGAVVDTRFGDVSVNSSHLYQVPLAHLMLDEEGQYTAEVSAYYVAAPAESSSVQAVSTFSVSGASSRSDVEALYQIIDAAYEDDLDFVDIEFFYFDENSPIASMNQSVSMFNAMGSTPSVAKTSGNVKMAGTRSTIDGFRVYRSSDNDSYLVSEQNMQYVNVLDAVMSEFAGYIEGEGNGSYNKVNYESSGGPQNEIYLPADTAVTFQTDLDKDTVVQISARAVSGTASLNGTVISTNTEMYYTLTVGEHGVITVTNGSATNVTGMLALGNLKLPATVSLSVPTEETYAIAYTMLRGFSETPVEPEPEPDPVFVPDKLDIDVTSRTVLFNRLVSITIKSSTDVAKLTVNGKTILPINVLLVKFGRADSYMYLFIDTVRRGQTESYEIVAYNAEGVASEVRTVNG